MPTVFRHNGYRFFFYSNEGTPREPRHIHVRKGDALAKFWLEPIPEIADWDLAVDGQAPYKIAPLR